MKMWKARWQEIVEVEVERVSDAYVWINGRRRNRRGSWETYHESWEKAKAHLIAEAERECQQAAYQLDYAHAKLEKVRALTPPNG